MDKFIQEISEWPGMISGFVAFREGSDILVVPEEKGEHYAGDPHLKMSCDHANIAEGVFGMLPQQQEGININTLLAIGFEKMAWTKSGETLARVTATFEYRITYDALEKNHDQVDDYFEAACQDMLGDMDEELASRIEEALCEEVQDNGVSELANVQVSCMTENIRLA